MQRDLIVCASSANAQLSNDMDTILKGDLIVTTKSIRDRIALFTEEGAPGQTMVSLGAGEKFLTATNSIGHGVFVKAITPAGQRALVPLQKGEWRAALEKTTS